MSRRVITTGRDNWSGQRPSTDADRLRQFGPLQPMEEERKSVLRSHLAFIAYTVAASWLAVMGLWSALS